MLKSTKVKGIYVLPNIFSCSHISRGVLGPSKGRFGLGEHVVSYSNDDDNKIDFKSIRKLLLNNFGRINSLCPTKPKEL